MATKAEMDSLMRTVRHIGIPLLLALIVGVAGFMVGNREELHAQDKRIVAIESTVPSMEIIEARFGAILIECQSMKGDLRVIRTEIQGFRKQLDELCRRVETLEMKAHAKEGD